MNEKYIPLLVAVVSIVLMLMVWGIIQLAHWAVNSIMNEEETSGWISVSIRPLTQLDGEVIGCHPEWVDDAHPEGNRIGFVNDEGKFRLAKYIHRDGYYWGYDTCLFPVKYFIIPKR